MRGQCRKHRVRHGRPINLRRAAHQQLDKRRQLVGHPGRFGRQHVLPGLARACALLLLALLLQLDGLLHEARHVAEACRAGRANQPPHLLLGQPVAGHQPEKQLLVVVADVAQVCRQPMQLVVAFARHRLAARQLEPLGNDALVGKPLERGREVNVGCRSLLPLGFLFRRWHGAISKHFRNFDCKHSFFIHIQRMPLGHHVDAPADILHSPVGLKAYRCRKTLLRLLCRHAPRQADEHMRTPAHRLLHQQHLPLASPVQLQRPGQYLGRMPLLVKVQHQPGQGSQGVGIGPMIVLELRAMGRPDGQLMLQLLLARLNAAAHLRQPRLAPQGFPLLPCGRHGRGTMSPPDTCKCLIVTHVFFV